MLTTGVDARSSFWIGRVPILWPNLPDRASHKSLSALYAVHNSPGDCIPSPNASRKKRLHPRKPSPLPRSNGVSRWAKKTQWGQPCPRCHTQEGPAPNGSQPFLCVVAGVAWSGWRGTAPWAAVASIAAVAGNVTRPTSWTRGVYKLSRPKNGIPCSVSSEPSSVQVHGPGRSSRPVVPGLALELGFCSDHGQFDAAEFLDRTRSHLRGLAIAAFI